MKKNKLTEILTHRYLSYSLLMLLGIFAGWLIFHPAKDHNESHDHSSEELTATVWTCSMHPQIRMNEPGKCPICAMDLIPLVQGGSATVDPGAVGMTEEAAMLANVQTTVVSRMKPVRVVRLYGTISTDERQLQNQVSHLSGRIEKLFISFTGETVAFGQPLARIYSPEIITGQQELLEAAKTKSIEPAIYEAAKEKLRQWKLTEAQIGNIESSATVQPEIEIVSNTSGIVTERLVNEGDYVSRGTVLYTIADLSKVWVLFDAYESDLRFLRKNDRLVFTLKAYPGTGFTGKIAFIDPVIDPLTRVAKVRVEADNRSGMLKPGMFATGIAESSPAGSGNDLVIPRSAVLWTGTRSVVYVKEPRSDRPLFRMREIALGSGLEDSWVVKDGLSEGEEIVTNGTFSVDAAAQLEGKPSMMNRSGGATGGTHGHQGINTGGGQAEASHDHSPITSGDNPGAMRSGGSGDTGMANDAMPDVTSGGRSKAVTGLTSSDIRVEGNCEMCKDRIEKAAGAVSGVETATWDMDKKMLHLTYSRSATTLDAIQQAIAKAGHDNGKYRAPDEVYNNLPECCLYRNNN
jgi:Cu(I)/Ag(I) efflux system membrane fusion protein